MPKVSVIIPTHNRVEMLQAAISSVLKQTFQDFEIVVIDDASTDNTGEIVHAINNNKIKYIRHQTNRREAGARNTGVQNSGGKYIAFLDDDDSWLSTKLEIQVNLLDTGPAKVGLVYSSYLKVDAQTGKALGRWVAEKRGNVWRSLSEKNWIGVPSTVVLRRECFDTVGLFDDQVAFGLDYDMWVRVARFYKFECIKEPLALRSINHDRLSTDYRLVLKGMESLLKKYPEFFSLNRKAYSRRLLRLGVMYCHNGHMRTGRATFLKAIQVNPFEARSYYNFALSLLGVENFQKMKNFRDRLGAF
jgi:glycosyltransferase involved in cell wall biosynthesis